MPDDERGDQDRRQAELQGQEDRRPAPRADAARAGASTILQQVMHVGARDVNRRHEAEHEHRRQRHER